MLNSALLTAPMVGIHLEQVPRALDWEDRTELDVIDSWTKEAAGGLGMLCVL